MTKTLLPIAAAVVLVASAAFAHAQTPPPGADSGRGLMVMAPGCWFQFHHGRIRAGDNIPASMALRNTGQWCLGSIAVSGASSSGARVVDAPNHGELRLKVVDGGVVFVYRPGPGYQGSDRFLISLPSGGGSDFNLAASVTVDP